MTRIATANTEPSGDAGRRRQYRRKYRGEYRRNPRLEASLGALDLSDAGPKRPPAPPEPPGGELEASREEVRRAKLAAKGLVSDAPARVARGAAWLDAHEPGWVWRVNPHTLTMESSCKCVGGQLCGDHGLFVVKHDLSWGDVLALGLVAGKKSLDDPSTYRPFTDEWKRVIAVRRGGGAA